MATTDLMAALDISAVAFMPQWRQEFSRQAGGTPRVADIGPAIWTAKVQTGEMLNDDAMGAAMLVNQMGGSLGTFYVWDPRRPYPKADPNGSILGSSAVTINSLGADNKSLSLTGLPAGYQLSKGDKIAWDYGSPAHRAFHEICEDVTASELGVTAEFEVNPHIRTGSSTGLTVILKQAAAEMMILPGSYDFPSAGALTSVISFTAIQVP